MKRTPWIRMVVTIVLLSAVPAAARESGNRTTVKGWVIDSACLFIKNLEKPVGPECAQKCAKAGSPLVILADDGTVYLPISSEMPATGQNERLMKYAGGKVVASGQVFERGGAHAIVIEQLEPAPAAR